MNSLFSTVSPLQLDFSCLTAQISAIGEHLKSKSWRVTCAESCTGGGIACALTSVAGSSQWFEQSFVTYANSAKQTLVGVREQTLYEHGAVSQQVVTEMVTGAAESTDSQCAIAVSGIAGPDGGTKEKPVGTVWFGFKIGTDVVTSNALFSGNRDQVRAQAICYAIDFLYLRLVE